MDTRARIVWVAILALISLQPKQAQEAICFDTRNPPFMFETEAGPEGLYPRLFIEALRRAGIAADLMSVPWPRALEGLLAGKNGVGGIYKTVDRGAVCDFSAPFYEERLAIYSRKGDDFSFVSIESLYGKTVGVIAGWAYSEEFSQAAASGKIDAEPSSGDYLNIRKLSNGRLDAVLAILESGDLAVREMGAEGRILRSPRLFATNKVYLAFNKSARRRPALDRFDKAVASMKEDGTFDRIVAESIELELPRN